MRLEVRFYKRFDPDLLALAELGVNLLEILRKALYAYARGERYQALVPVCKPHDLSGRQGMHSGTNITDEASIKLLQQIKVSYRNSFCKILIRDALVAQSLCVFMSNPAYIKQEKQRIHAIEANGTDELDVLYPTKKQDTLEKVLGKGARKEPQEKDAKKTQNIQQKPKPDHVRPQPAKPEQEIDPFGLAGTEDNVVFSHMPIQEDASVANSKQEDVIFETQRDAEPEPEGAGELLDVFKSMLEEGGAGV